MKVMVPRWLVGLAVGLGVWVVVWTGIRVSGPAAAAAPVRASESVSAILQGLPGVWVRMEGAAPGVGKDGAGSETLEAEVAIQLRQAGVPVLGEHEADERPGGPQLVLNVNVMDLADGRGHAYAVAVELRERVRLARASRTEVRATTWSKRAMGVVPSDRMHAIRDRVKDIVAVFAVEYLEANEGGRGDPGANPASKHASEPHTSGEQP
jgi:hypothetical protein